MTTLNSSEPHKEGYPPINILVVDDADDVRAMLVAVCSRIEGVKVREAIGGDEAIALALEERPDLVLMDLMMPGMDGFEATLRIKEIYPHTIVLAVTAVLDEATERKMRRQGASGYIRKPVTEPGRIRYKIANFVNHLRSGHAVGVFGVSREATNPFCSEIRAVRTVVNVATEADMMDLGLWLIERYMIHNATQGVEFNRSLDLLYGVISHALHRHVPTAVQIEENYDSLFLCVSLYEPLNEEVLQERFRSVIGENLHVEEKQVCLKIRLRCDEGGERSAAAAAAMPPKSAESKPEPVLAARTLDEGERQLLRQSHIEKLSAADYLATLSDSDLHEVQDMREIEEEWMQALGELELACTPANLHQVGVSAARYAGVVNSLYEFATLGYALSSLAVLIQGADQETLERIQPGRLVILLSGMLEDMRKWRTTIFAQRDTNDIHYLDSSLLSSCMQIEALLLNQEVAVEEGEDELELF